MIQIDMKMPDNCDECRFNTEYAFCKAMPDNFCGNTDDRKRPEWCPLKEQKAVEPEVEVLNEIDRIYRCPKCHKHFFYEKQKHCDQCGQEVKWE